MFNIVCKLSQVLSLPSLSSFSVFLYPFLCVCVCVCLPSCGLSYLSGIILADSLPVFALPSGFFPLYFLARQKGQHSFLSSSPSTPRRQKVAIQSSPHLPQCLSNRCVCSIMQPGCQLTAQLARQAKRPLGSITDVSERSADSPAACSPPAPTVAATWEAKVKPTANSRPALTPFFNASLPECACKMRQTTIAPQSLYIPLLSLFVYSTPSDTEATFTTLLCVCGKTARLLAAVTVTCCRVMWTMAIVYSNSL